MQHSRVEQDAEYYRTHQHTNSNARKNIFQSKSSFPLQGNYLPRILRRLWQDSAKVPSRGVWLFRLARILSGVGWLCGRMLMETHARSILHLSFTHHVRASVWLQTCLFHLSRISVLVWIHWKMEQKKRSYEKCTDVQVWSLFSLHAEEEISGTLK